MIKNEKEREHVCVCGVDREGMWMTGREMNDDERSYHELPLRNDVVIYCIRAVAFLAVDLRTLPQMMVVCCVIFVLLIRGHII